MVPANEIFEVALQLDGDQRAALAERLWASLDPSPAEAVEAAWASEVERRIVDLDSGAVKAVPWEEARARISGAIARGRLP